MCSRVGHHSREPQPILSKMMQEFSRSSGAEPEELAGKGVLVEQERAGPTFDTSPGEIDWVEDLTSAGFVEGGQLAVLRAGSAA